MSIKFIKQDILAKAETHERQTESCTGVKRGSSYLLKMPENERKLFLHSPALSEQATYKWPLVRSVSAYTTL